VALCDVALLARTGPIATLQAEAHSSDVGLQKNTVMAGNKRGSKKENKLVSTEKEINNTTNIPLGPNNTSCHLGPPHVLFSCGASFLR
jgi:hypothetical protein